MSKPRMYECGEQYRSIQEFLTDYLDTSSSALRYAYFNSKLMHVNFVAGMPLGNLVNAINAGHLYRAYKREPVA